MKVCEVLLKRWDGSVVWVSTTSQWYTDIEGRILGIEGMFRDITECKQMEEELQKYRDTLKNP
jgi:PAS domain S-box-containing protein